MVVIVSPSLEIAATVTTAAPTVIVSPILSLRVSAAAILKLFEATFAAVSAVIAVKIGLRGA